ncbi:Glu/Leu/Phe/Val dehydrogenase [Cystobacter fuscus]|uniref:Glu/Leu/Phe/Val dehydrogenase n=1 Tax=Cystobacter fuscus TaxID=43 RepID=UPI0037BFD666
MKEPGVPALSTTITDEQTGLKGWVVVDSLLGGRAIGGTRMTPGVNDKELATLARTMTCKLALAGLPIGGAKAGIASNLPRGEARSRQLAAFGRLAAPLVHGGIYIGSDQGVGYEDRELIHRAAGYEVTAQGKPLPFSWSELWDRCEDVTGHGVCQSTSVIADHLMLPPEMRTVVIQGFGLVGRGVARGLSAWGYKIIGVADAQGTVYSHDGLPVEALLAATDSAGTIDRKRLPDWIQTSSEPDMWLSLRCGLLVLAAVGNAVHEKNVERVNARAVIEGANNPCSHEAILALHRRGVAVMPDIVANSGGATVSALFLLGLTPPLALGSLVTWCFEEVARRVKSNSALFVRGYLQEGKPIHELAHAVAHERLEVLRSALQTGMSPTEAAALLEVSTMSAPQVH